MERSCVCREIIKSEYFEVPGFVCAVSDYKSTTCVFKDLRKAPTRCS